MNRTRVVFLMDRKNYYRVLGPAVEAALKRGWAVECWHDWAQPRWGTKASEFPDAAPLFRRGAPEVSIHQGQGEMVARLLADPPDAVLALAPPPEALRGRVRWIGVQYMTNLVNPFGAEGLASTDLVAGYSPFWLEQAFAYLASTGAPVGPEARAAIRRRFRVVGVPELDQVDLITPAAVRRQLGLPEGRPVVLYLPYPLRSNPPTFWARHVWGPPGRLRRGAAVLAGLRLRYWPWVARDWCDRRLVQSLRAFCDANRALLVVKSRLKDPVPPHTRALADLVLYDPSHYPATILELLSVAGLCVHFYSSAAYEAIFSGVPSLSIAPDPADMGLAPAWSRTLFHPQEGGSYRWAGAAWCLTVPEAIEDLPRRRLGDFALDPGARGRYVQTFLGFDDTRASERLLDLVEAPA